ncbi:hypothetical protein Bca52824_080044 [Brassica carinata]|uniref:Uncharacterized protein n=1 Tax=Brassica carinata TaxID=52824 RepID=A0A8X7PZN1_BRACI|nr:hypothetical protein Bca52824_080044 [Brassica carinata]
MIPELYVHCEPTIMADLLESWKLVHDFARDETFLWLHIENVITLTSLVRWELKANEKHLEECTVSNVLGTWVFSVIDALVAIPVGIKRKSLGPLCSSAQPEPCSDIIIGVTQCEREHAEHQKKLLQDSQNAATNNNNADTDSIS